MKYFIKHSGVENKGQAQSEKHQPANKLFVAYVNRDIVNDDIYDDEGFNDVPGYKATTFNSSDVQTPVILSHEEEMMLYSDEYY